MVNGAQERFKGSHSTPNWKTHIFGEVARASAVPSFPFCVTHYERSFDSFKLALGAEPALRLFRLADLHVLRPETSISLPFLNLLSACSLSSR